MGNILIIKGANFSLNKVEKIAEYPQWIKDACVKFGLDAEVLLSLYETYGDNIKNGVEGKSYIKGSGGGIIPTGFVPSFNMSIKTKFAFDTSNSIIAGTRNNVSTDTRFYMPNIDSNNKIGICIGTALISNIAIEIGRFYEEEIHLTSTTYNVKLDGVEIMDGNNYDNTFSLSLPMYLLGINIGNSLAQSSNNKVSYYYMDDGTHKAMLIPLSYGGNVGMIDLFTGEIKNPINGSVTYGLIE